MFIVDRANFLANAGEFIRKIGDGRLGNVMHVTHDGNDVIILRQQQYTPRLDRFNMTPSGDILCSDCLQTIEINNPYNLAAAANAANEHWRNTHRKASK